MNEPEKLTIRINFRKKKDGAPGDKSCCIYHRGRIIGVSLAVIVALASLISAGSYYLNQDKIDSEYVKSATNNVADKSIASLPSLSLKKDTVGTVKPSPTETDTVIEKTAVINPAVAETASEETAVIKPAVTEIVIEDIAVIKPTVAETASEETASEETAVINPAVAETASEDTAIIKPAVAETVIDDIAVIKPVLAETDPEDTAIINPAVAETVIDDIAVIKPVLAETTPEDTAVIKPAEDNNTVSQALFTQSQKNLLSDNISRFVISQAVEGNEPIGDISDIQFDDNNIATVYAYSDVNALKDQTLYYQWSLDGKNIAKVRVDVGSNRWRSYSSKFIQPHMRGEWKVELQNHAGENLATNQFNY